MKSVKLVGGSSLFGFLCLFVLQTGFAKPGEDRPGHGKRWGMHGAYHGAYHGAGYGKMWWMKSLSKEQRAKVLKLKVAFKSKKMLIMLDMKKAKIRLVTQISSTSPNKGAIEKIAGEIADLKKKKLLLIADHKIAVRKILNTEQKAKFDLFLLKKAMMGKKRGKGCGFHRRHHGRNHGRYHR